MRNIFLSIILTSVILFITGCSKKSDVNPNPIPNPVSTTPSLTTLGAVSVTINSAECKATISSDGGVTITERGICYNTAGNPTVTDNKISSGAGPGDFSVALSALTDNTMYHYRAYCINANGTYYSADAQFHTLKIFTMGESYGGGIIFYIDNTNQHGLIVPSIGAEAYSNWDCEITLNNCYGTAVGTGASNTAAIISQCNVTTAAAAICYYLDFNGYTDWFLPSRDELNLMYEQRVLIGDFNLSSYYWSSSQYNGQFAYHQNFSTGIVTLEDKIAGNRLRPIRKF